MNKILTLSLPLFLAVPALAQEADQTPAEPVQPQRGVYLQSAEDVEVRNGDGDRIGEVEEILVDEKGNPAGFLIELGGFLGLGDSAVVVPLDSLSWDGQGYVSNMTETQLENLQPFGE